MQPRLPRLSVTIKITVAALLSALAAILSNLVANAIPQVLLPYLYLAVPAFIIVIALDIGFAIWKAHHDISVPLPIIATMPSQSVIALVASQSGDKSITELLEPLTKKPECAWVIAWQGGERISNIEFRYDDQPNANRYTSTLQDDLLQVIDEWGKMHQERYNELKEEAECVAVRIRRARRLHYPANNAVPLLKFCIWLEPTKYLYYVAIHPYLGKPEARSLRKKYFSNALLGLESDQPLELPSNSALHVVVVSRDRHLLLRQRIRSATNYPLAWEAGVGEFMHGPGPSGSSDPEIKADPTRSLFRHFSKERTPDLFFFLKNAIAEELGYRGARQGDFCLYGFAVEYQTLAPKLLAVYNSDRTIEELLRSAKSQEAKDPARDVSSIELTPRAIAEAFASTKYSSWEPKSKLLILLALKQDLEAIGKQDQSFEIEKLTDRFKLGEEPVDPWEFHGHS